MNAALRNMNDRLYPKKAARLAKEKLEREKAAREAEQKVREAERNLKKQLIKLD